MNGAGRSADDEGAERVFALLPWCGVVSLIVGALIGMHRAPSLWFDEMDTLITISDPSFSHMIHGMVAGAEGSPPLYHTLARSWGTLFGFSQGPLRMFSVLGFVAALLATNALLRRYFSRRAAAYAVVTVFAGSELVFTNALQLRFYGLFLFVAVLAIWSSCLVMESSDESTRKPQMLLAVSLAALLYTHVFGIVYSIVLAVAVLAGELLLWKRVRVRTASAIGFAFLSFVPWIPAFKAQIAVSGSDLYIPPTGPRTMLDAYGFEVHGFVIYMALLVVASVISRSGAAIVVDRGGKRSRAPVRLVGAALFAVPLLTAVASHVTTPLFNARYLLPGIVGLAILVAEVADGLGTTSGADAPRSRRLATDLVLVAGAVIALGLPLLEGARSDITTPPNTLLDAQIDPALRALPVALESPLDYTPLWYYSGKREGHYFFVMDSVAGVQPLAARGTMAEVRWARAWQEIGYTRDMIDAADFLAGHDRFIVVDYPQRRFFEYRVRGNPGWTSCRVGTYGFAAVRLVVRRGMTLDHCREDVD